MPTTHKQGEQPQKLTRQMTWRLSDRVSGYSGYRLSRVLCQGLSCLRLTLATVGIRTAAPSPTRAKCAQCALRTQTQTDKGRKPLPLPRLDSMLKVGVQQTVLTQSTAARFSLVRTVVSGSLSLAAKARLKLFLYITTVCKHWVPIWQ